MNKILVKISEIIKSDIEKYLPNVRMSDLEGNGKIYYMNDNNGTAFDYYANNHLSSFMCFYDDKENMGAIKLILSNDGNVSVYIFLNHENKPIREENEILKVSENEILELAVIMDKVADKCEKWGCAIEDMDTDIKLTEDEIEEFCSQEEDLVIFNELSKTCIVTKKLLNENWKVGLMQKMESNSEMDSGWFLIAGNESQEYVNDSNNLCIITLREIFEKDPVILPYLLDKNVGEVYIRISDDEFEIDDNEREIYVSKLN